MPDLVTQLSGMIARVTDGDPPGPDARFDALDGWSSLQALALMVAIEQDLPVTLDLRPFMAVQTVGELAGLVGRLLPAASPAGDGDRAALSTVDHRPAAPPAGDGGPDRAAPATVDHRPDASPAGDGGPDRAALSTVDAEPVPVRGGGTGLATDTERRIAGIWAQVLGRTPTRDDHFFTIGGDSMTALQVAMAAEEDGLPLAVRDLFLHPVLADLAAATGPAAAAPARAAADGPSTSDTAGVEQSYPALRIQAGMLFESERDPDRPTYHVVSENELDARGVSRDALAGALAAVAKAQPGLRTGFDLVHADGPRRLVRELPDPPLRYADLTALAPAEAAARLAEIRRDERVDAFGWDDFPLWRLACAVLPGGRARLFLTHHHAVLDGWSVAVFFDQLRAALAGEVVPSPVDACLLAADAEAEALGSAEAVEHWSAIAREFRALAVPARQRLAGEPAVWSVTRAVGQRVRDDVGRACAAWRCSPKQLFLAVHLRALAVAAGPDAPAPGAVAVVNARPEAEDVHLALGVFLNAVPVLPAPPGAGWRELVEHVATAELDMLEHRHYPLADMRGRLGLPGPTTWFTYTDFGGTSMGDFLASVTDHNVTELPLTVSVVDDGLLLDGSTDHFTRAEVEELARVHVECLHGAIQAALQRPV